MGLEERIIAHLQTVLDEAEPDSSDVTATDLAQNLGIKQQAIDEALERLIDTELVYTWASRWPTFNVDDGLLYLFEAGWEWEA